MKVLRARIATIQNVLAEPKVDVEILDFTLVEPVLAVRPYCHNDNCRQVYFDTSETRGFGRAGLPVPVQSVWRRAIEPSVFAFEVRQMRVLCLKTQGCATACG